MATVSYLAPSELESLCGEVLPPRLVLSPIDVSFVRNSYTTNSFPAANSFPAQGAGGGGHGSSVADACQEVSSPESNSGLLGLWVTPAQNTVQCTPAVVHSGS